MKAAAFAVVVVGGLLGFEAVRGLKAQAATATAPSGGPTPSASGMSSAATSGASSPNTASAGVPNGYIAGQVSNWVYQASKLLEGLGYNITPAQQQQFGLVVMNEGGASPGVASAQGAIGPAQVLPSTFAGTGFTNILDPVQNIAAGMLYAIKRYGSISNIPGVISLQTGQPVYGYPGAYCAQHAGYGLYCTY